MTINGILDISRWQTVDWQNKPIPLDWGKIAAATFPFQGQTVKVVGVIIKCTEGEYGWKHDRYLECIKAADAAGLWTGSYHWLWATYNWARQADFYNANVWKNPNPKEIILEDGTKLPHNWVDVEETEDLKTYPPGSRYKIADAAYGWCSRVPDSGLYSGDWYWRALEHPGGGVPLWVADYTNPPKPALPYGWDKYALWQFGSRGQIDGIEINGTHINTDLNICNVKDTTPEPPPFVSLEDQVAELYLEVDAIKARLTALENRANGV